MGMRTTPASWRVTGRSQWVSLCGALSRMLVRCTGCCAAQIPLLGTKELFPQWYPQLWAYSETFLNWREPPWPKSHPVPRAAAHNQGMMDAGLPRPRSLGPAQDDSEGPSPLMSLLARPAGSSDGSHVAQPLSLFPVLLPFLLEVLIPRALPDMPISISENVSQEIQLLTPTGV